MRVALIGLDGSGKSANIELLRSDPTFSKCRLIWVRWKPLFLRPVYKLLDRHCRKAVGQHGAAGKRDSADHVLRKDLKEKVFRSPLIRRIWMIFALVDYLIQFYAKSLGSLVTGRSIIFDRFYIDLFIDQGISFSYSLEKICSMIRRYRFLFPQLDRIIYIRVTPEICYERKDDIPDMEYLYKRLYVYEMLCNDQGWTTINGEEPLDKVYRSIKDTILRL